MNTLELVTAGYALAKVLDVESASLVKQLADALAVQRVRADELNKQVVNLAVENAGLKNHEPQPFGQLMNDVLDAYEARAEDVPELAMLNAYRALRLSIETPATDIAMVEVEVQAVEKFADKCDVDALLVEPEDFELYELMAENARTYVAELRKGTAV